MPVQRNKAEKGDWECWGEEYQKFEQLVKEVSLRRHCVKS